MRRRRRGRRGTRRPTQWFSASAGYTQLTQAVTLGGATLLINLLSTSVVTAVEVPQIGRLTVERIRGEVLVHPRAGTGWTGADSALIAMGIMVVTTTGAGVPAAVDPTAHLDADRQWMWLQHFVVQSDQGISFHDLFAIPVDIKSRRIVRPDQSLVLAVKAVNIFATGTAIDVRPFLRTLVMKVA